jgi:polyvinyl alcohol dehydrogenase (cytochrome)
MRPVAILASLTLLCRIVPAVAAPQNASTQEGGSFSPSGVCSDAADKSCVGTEYGFSTFQMKCMSCHGNPKVRRAPSPTAIREMSPERIYQALTTGVMKTQGASLSDDEKKTLALFMSGRPLGSMTLGDAKNMPNHCPSNPPLANQALGASWNGWGIDETNSRFQSAKNAGLVVTDIPKLKLKWAFAFPTGVSSFAQPTVVSGRVFVGSDIGYVYSLDAKTGCVYWSYATKGSVRNAMSVGPAKHAGAEYAVYFGDAHANVYALDAQSGKELWVKKVENHFTARITAAPTLYAGRLYLGVSSSEEFAAQTPDYPCCTFRGSMVALNAYTGAQVWKTYMVGSPKPRKKNSNGVQLYAPAGVSVWNSPTVDIKRRAVYFGTGDAETCPAADTSDAVMAVSMDTGKRLWAYQAQAGDCMPDASAGGPQDFPDLDIGNSPVLRTLSNGKRVVIVGTKDGYVFALDPDNNGALVWKTEVAGNPKGTQEPSGIIWGGASDDTNVYYGLSGGGIVAVRLISGECAWFTSFSNGAHSVENVAAASAMPGVAFVGGTDGKLHALRTADGHQIWEYDTAHEYNTVNQVPGKGGAMFAPGPVIAGGMLFVNSGYGVWNGPPGNVVLAFGPE